MSGWTDVEESANAATVAEERQRLAGGGKAPVLVAKALLLIWTLFVLGFVLVLSAAIAYSAEFNASGTACVLAGVGCLVAASVWQWRASGARLPELGRSSAYSHMPAPGVGVAPYSIQDEAEGPAQAFHF